jgi:hypothetical protein
MGGTTQTKDTNSAFNQNSLQQFQNASTGASSGSTNPWAASQPFLGGILAQLQGALPTTAITPAEENALEGLSNSSGYISQFLPGTTALANTLLAGGNAQAYAPLAQSAYSQYAGELNPYLQSSFLDPRNAPGFSDALAATNADITNQVNGMFAGAGRDLSGLNQQALARGLAQGEGQLIANQYNQNVANQLGAMQSAYGAGNTTAGLLSSLNQQALADAQAGLGVAQTGQQFASAPYQAQLAEEAARRGIPLSALQTLVSRGVPLAGLGSTTNGAMSATQGGSTSGTQAGSGTQEQTTSTPFNPLSLLPLGLLPLSGTGPPELLSPKSKAALEKLRRWRGGESPTGKASEHTGAD